MGGIYDTGPQHYFGLIERKSPQDAQEAASCRKDGDTRRQTNRGHPVVPVVALDVKRLSKHITLLAQGLPQGPKTPYSKYSSTTTQQKYTHSENACKC